MTNQPHINGVCYDESLPVLDREQIEMLLMADDGEDMTELIRDIFELFCEESSEKLTGLEAACQENDLKALRKMVHFVAGSAGNLGLFRMCSFFRGIEQSIDSGELTDVSICVDPVRSEFLYGCEVFQKKLGL